MALVKCKECGNEISNKAKECPNCGAPAPKPSGGTGCAAVVMLVLIGAFVYTFFFGGDGPVEPYAYSAKEPIPYSLQVEDYIPEAKLQLLVRCDLADGWLPPLAALKQIADDACQRFGISAPEQVERVFVSFTLPKMSAYFAGYHNEKGKVVETKYYAVNLDQSPYIALQPPEKKCPSPPADPKTDDPYQLFRAAEKAKDAGCVDAAVRLFTRALDSGELGVKTTLEDPPFMLSFGDKPPKKRPRKKVTRDYEARALGFRGEAWCQLAVLRRDRGLYARAISDLERAVKQISDKDSDAEWLRRPWRRLLKGARHVAAPDMATTAHGRTSIDGHYWVQASDADRARVALKLVELTTGRRDSTLAAELMDGLNAFYGPDTLDCKLSEAAAMLLVVLEGKR